MTVTPGQNASCSIEVKEIQGKGEINFNITDSTGALTTLTAEISNDNEIVVATAELNKDDNNIFSGSVKVDNGFYMVLIKAGENEILKVDSVRVYADITTIYNGTYDGETINVTVTDEIIKTPDLTLTITSGASVAANGTLTASATVTNLENPSYAWYINGTKLENSTDSDLSYKIEGSAYAEEETLEVTVFISNGSIIWSESKTVTVTEAVTLPSEVTISQDKTAYGSEITLSYETDENIPEGTAATWTVKGTVLESATFAPSIIGHEIPVSLTLNAGGVTQTYTSSIEINPVVSNFNVTPNSVPEKAVLAVESTVNAPEDAVLSAVIGEETIDVSAGKLTLPEGLSGEVSISWSISYNDESWTGETTATVAVTESAATPAPEINTDSSFGGATDDEKEKTVENVLNALSESGIDFLETSDGEFNLDRTIEKVNEGYKYYGFSSGDYVFWGSKDGSIVDITVSDKTNVFTIRAEGTSYILNDVQIVTIPTEAPAVNTNPGFGGNAEERYNLVMSIYNEIMEAVWYGIPDRMEFTDGHATMTGLQTRSYIIWGAAIVDPSSFALSSANVTVMDSDGNIFEITTENGTFYVNGEVCQKPEIAEPVEPDEGLFADATGVQPGTIEEYEIANQIHDDMSDLYYNTFSYTFSYLMFLIEITDLDVGDYIVSIDPKTLTTKTIVDNDIVADIEIDDPEGRPYAIYRDVTIKKGSSSISGMESATDDLHFIYNGVEYKVHGNGTEFTFEIINSSEGSEILPDTEINDLASGISSYTGFASAMLLLENDTFLNQVLNKSFQLEDNLCFEIRSIAINPDAPLMDILVSCLNYSMYGTTTITSKGMHIYVDISEKNEVTDHVCGPVIYNGEEYYIDYNYSQVPGEQYAGIKIDGTWKDVTEFMPD